MLDRLMIFCSVVELLCLICGEGPGCLTAFQWTMLGLLIVKLTAVVPMVLRKNDGRGDQAGGRP